MIENIPSINRNEPKKLSFCFRMFPMKVAIKSWVHFAIEVVKASLKSFSHLIYCGWNQKLFNSKNHSIHLLNRALNQKLFVSNSFKKNSEQALRMKTSIISKQRIVAFHSAKWRKKSFHQKNSHSNFLWDLKSNSFEENKREKPWLRHSEHQYFSWIPIFLSAFHRKCH